MTRLDFLANIVARPSDRTTYLALADWLEEQNGPDHQTQLIRANAGHWSMSPSEQRVRQNLVRHDALSLFASSPPVVRFHSGMIYSVHLRADQMIQNDAVHRLFSLQPITAVILIDREPFYDSEVEFPYAWFVAQRGKTLVNTGNELHYEYGCLLRDCDGQEPDTDEYGSMGVMSYETNEQALDALSLACVAYGRRLAGYPVLTA
jgi:uncharacterized protein (TIGR02996 family)